MSYQPHQSEDLTLKPVAGSEPAQGEAMEVLRELVEVITDEPRPFAARRTQWFKHLNAILDRARALVAASPCAAQPTDAFDNTHFLAARLRRLFAHFDYPLPDFAADDARLVGIAGSCIGALLLRLETADAAAAQGGQQPVAWRLEYTDPGTGERDFAVWRHKPKGYELMPGDIVSPLYAAPAPAAPLTARMLTPQEVAGIDAEFYGGDPTEYANAAIRKFCEVNGITLAGTAGTKKESE